MLGLCLLSQKGFFGHFPTIQDYFKTSALRVGVEFILLLGEVCHVTNCDNSEHAFVNEGDSRYLVCSSWNICILIDSFFIVCPWII